MSTKAKLIPKARLGHSAKPYRLGEDPVRDALRHELIERTKRNSNYSLRAFARNLEIEASLLSKLISGKRKITRKMAERLIPHLGLSANLLESLKKSPAKPLADNHFSALTSDEFAIISDWYHLPILELSLTKDFDPDPRWISKRLGISQLEAEVAIQRLEKLKFISKSKDGSWSLSRPQNTTLGQAETSSALRSNQRALLQKAIEALDQIQAQDRDQTGISMAIDKDLIEEARAELKAFRRRFCKKYQSRRPYNEVYQLLISFFPLSRS